MHYCQRCETPVHLLPNGDHASCPTGHYNEPARRLPLFVVTGASGSGKSAVFPFLAAELQEYAVFDADLLIDPFGLACAPDPINWTAFRDAWLAVAHSVAQSGRATVLLSPFIAPGTVSTVPYNHYSMLRSVEDIFGLAHLGYAGQEGLVSFGRDIYR